MGGKKNRPKTKWRKVSIGNADDSADSQTDETPEHNDATQNGFQSHDHNHIEGDQYYDHRHASYDTYQPNVYFVKENGFLPFPVAAAPGPPPSEAQEDGGAGCYVNGLWIPNTELFKYGVHPPPPSQPNQSPSMVYHPNVPWVCLRPLSAGGGNGGNPHHHHQHHQQQQQAQIVNGNPSNAQYFLYFTRKPPPWFQRQRDSWRRRPHPHHQHHGNMMHHPSPYWSFNHGVQAVLPPGGDWERNEVEQGNMPPPVELLSDPLEQVDVSSTTNTTAPYVYPGYSFGQPVFTAPVLPVKPRSTSPGSNSSKPLEAKAPKATQSSPSPSKEPETAPNEQQKTSASPSPPPLTSTTTSATNPAQTSEGVEIESKPESSNQKPKKKKKRKKARSEMEMVPEDSVVEGSSSTTPAKPDHLELKIEVNQSSSSSSQLLSNGDAIKLCNGEEPVEEVELSSTRQSNQIIFECPRPILEFAESLVQIALAQVQEELQRQQSCSRNQVATKDIATDIVLLHKDPAMSSLASTFDENACVV